MEQQVMIRACVAVALLASVIEAACPGGIPEAEVKAILDSHNRLRSNLSKGKYVAKGKQMPAAKKTIPALKWDCDLEKSAQKVAGQCTFVHSEGRGYRGENLWRNTGSHTLEIAGMGKLASGSWKEEFQDYGWPTLTFNMDDVNVGRHHATQMTWNTTEAIGCGIARCKNNTQVIVACWYAPNGNWLGSQAYEPKIQK